MYPACNSWVLEWFYFHICRKCEMKYAGSLWQNYMSGNVWKMMSDAEKYFHFQLQTMLSHMKWIMPDLSRIIIFQKMHVRKMVSGVVDNFLFQLVNTLSPLFSIRHFQMHFLELKWISIKISPHLVLDGSINSIPALIPIIVWCQSGDKPLSESMMA